MLKAVAPSTQDDFIGSTSRGHGNPNGENQGFVRDNAILAIVQVTDEEDCSIKDGGQVLFETQYVGNDTSNDRWRRVPLNLRCGQAAEEQDSDLIQPTDRYIEGLKALKPDNPDRVIFAGIVGIPDFLEEDIAAGRYAEVLAHQNMQFAPEPVRTDLPKVSCSVTRPGARELRAVLHLPQRLPAGGQPDHRAHRLQAEGQLPAAPAHARRRRPGALRGLRAARARCHRLQAREGPHRQRREA
jgi:hypothetical protein